MGKSEAFPGGSDGIYGRLAIQQSCTLSSRAGQFAEDLWIFQPCSSTPPCFQAQSVANVMLTSGIRGYRRLWRRSAGTPERTRGGMPTRGNGRARDNRQEEREERSGDYGASQAHVSLIHADRRSRQRPLTLTVAVAAGTQRETPVLSGLTSKRRRRKRWIQPPRTWKLRALGLLFLNFTPSAL